MKLFEEPSFEDYYEDCKEKVFSDIKYSFYIPSKGRPNAIKSVHTLDTLGIKASVVVEPQDYGSYKEFNPDLDIIQMDKNDQGIYYVRNFIKDYSKNKNEDYHWQLDDDIKAFYDRQNKKKPVTTSWWFSFCESLSSGIKNIGSIGAIHDAFAFARKTDFEVNKQTATCILVNNDTRFPSEPSIIEDTDYSLQCLYGGYITINLNRFTYLPEPNAKQSGGNTNAYLSDVMYKRQLALQEKYPGFFTIYEKDGLSRVRPSKIWQQFKYKPEPIYEQMG